MTLGVAEFVRRFCLHLLPALRQNPPLRAAGQSPKKGSHRSDPRRTGRPAGARGDPATNRARRHHRAATPVPALRCLGPDLAGRNSASIPAFASANDRYVMKTVIPHQARGQRQRTALRPARPLCNSRRADHWNHQGHPIAQGDHGVCPPTAGPVQADIPHANHRVRGWRQATRAYFPM